MEHISVLLKESVESLNIKEDGIYVDATLGGGGHSSAILKKLKTGHLYCFEQDDFAINYAKDRLSEISSNFTIIKSNFVNLADELKKLKITKIDGIIYDLGVSSFQFDLVDRGFSYKNDARLDMRMNQDNPLDAYTIVNEWSFEELIKIFFQYGEEPFSKKIAYKICDARKEREIVTTFDLVEVIKSALPQKILKQKGHPAKQIFQALRIAVNNELEVFEKSLEQAISILKDEGRIVVITFHSLEDRICKKTFKKYSEINLPKNLPIIQTELPPLKLITKKAYLPTEEEIKLNNRAHSAKMRVCEKNRE